VPNINTTQLRQDGQLRRARLGELAGAEHLGLTVSGYAGGRPGSELPETERPR